MPIDFRQRVPSQVAATSADPFRRALDFYPASAARRAGFFIVLAQRLVSLS
jgi:hypothetical protein